MLLVMKLRIRIGEEWEFYWSRSLGLGRMKAGHTTVHKLYGQDGRRENMQMVTNY